MGQFLYLLGIAFAGAYVAKKRKLNPFFWFGICFALGPIAFLSFIFMPFFLKNRKKGVPPALIVPAPLPFSAETIWYYLDEKEEQKGPMSFLKLQEIRRDGVIHEATYIWTETFDHWKQWKDVLPSAKKEE